MQNLALSLDRQRVFNMLTASRVVSLLVHGSRDITFPLILVDSGLISNHVICLSHLNAT